VFLSRSLVSSFRTVSLSKSVVKTLVNLATSLVSEQNLHKDFFFCPTPFFQFMTGLSPALLLPPTHTVQFCRFCLPPFHDAFRIRQEEKTFLKEGTARGVEKGQGGSGSTDAGTSKSVVGNGKESASVFASCACHQFFSHGRRYVSPLL